MPASEATPAAPNGLKCMLPKDFEPSDYDFVIGRGKQVKQLPGNQRLSKLIHLVADDYTSGDKARKSFLLSQLVKQVYEKSPRAGFVKKDPVSGRWYAVEEALARTSAAQAVRDCLCSHYKSSRQFKQKRRRQAKKEQVPVQAIPCSSVPLTDDMEEEGSVTDARNTPPRPMMNGVMPAKISAGPVQDFATTIPLASMPGFRRCVTDDANRVSASSSSSPFVCPSSSSWQVKKDMFSILMANFLPKNNNITQADPFEPVPILEQQHPAMLSAQDRLSNILDSALDLGNDLFEDFAPLSHHQEEPTFVDSMFTEI